MKKRRDCTFVATPAPVSEVQSRSPNPKEKCLIRQAFQFELEELEVVAVNALAAGPLADGAVVELAADMVALVAAVSSGAVFRVAMRCLSAS